MNCQGAIERLGDHLDAALSKPEASELENHLVSCAACREELEALRRTLAAVKALPRVKAPRGFAAGVMAEIRNETVVKPLAPARVTPIRSFTIFTRLAASIAAICLVWVGVRALRVERGPVSGETASASWKSPGSASGSNQAQEPALKQPSTAAKENGLAPREAPPADAAAPKPEVPQKAGATDLGASGSSWTGKPTSNPDALAVQRITVYSSDIAVDATQVRKLLAESGYTYSTQKKAIFVRVPASEATRLVASLSGMPGGFRAADRQSLESLEKAKESRDKALEDSKTQKSDAPADKLSGKLTADADDLKEALRRHVDESRRAIRSKEQQKAKAEEKRGGMLAAGDSASDGYGKSGLEGGAKKKDGDLRDGEEGKDEHEETSHGVALAPGAPAGGGATGGRPAEDAEKKRKDEANRDGGKSPVKGEQAAQSENGGTDDLAGRSRREKELDDVLADELKKLESERKLADAEDAVVLLIEFEEPAAAAPPAANDPQPGKK